MSGSTGPTCPLSREPDRSGVTVVELHSEPSAADYRVAMALADARFVFFYLGL